MSNLIRMDLHRMFRARSFKVCLVLALLFGFCGMPFLKLFSMLLEFFPGTPEGLVPQSVDLSSILSEMFPLFNGILLMFSVCYFFYADIEYGFIKNIAGQMPKKGFTILSKFLAAIVHNLIFIAVGIIGNVIGHVLFVKINVDSDVIKTIGALGVRFLLLQGICALLLLVTASLRSKTFGMVLSVILSSGSMKLLYVSIDTGIGLLLKRSVQIERYMPDQLMVQQFPKLIPALPVAAVTILLFLLLAVWVFDHRDVK